ncbi:DUF2798 domain-containing protein [Methylobacillus sp. Pita2]|uniref:DUF2798 domain-containing protein n=1 Tax=unclassified Methylobacillus TaxID=2647660 RepID=UPI0038B5DC3B
MVRLPPHGRRLHSRYRKPLFAFVMSAVTSLIVSAVILALRGMPAPLFLHQWAHAFITAWPVVFLSIILIAPRIDCLLDRVVERD